MVLATLVLQGLTLAPIIRLLGLDRLEDPDAELREGRRRLTDAALARLEGLPHAASPLETYRAGWVRMPPPPNDSPANATRASP